MPGRLLPALLAALAFALAASGCQPKSSPCTSPELLCGSGCVNGLTDPTNCGGCGITCGGGQACCGFCTDLATDASDCGACFNRCPTNGGTCSGGTCSCPASAPDACGYVPGVSAGTCVNLDTGAGGYCGSCGWVCAATGVNGAKAPCVAGSCACAGPPDATDCGNGGTGQCVNTLVDPENCGTCGQKCQAHATCAGTTTGTCGCRNPAFPDDCGATAGCVNVESDAANCGACGTTCPGSAPTCSNAKCCPSGTTNCSGTCVDTRTNDANCGGCGNACGPGRTCSGGTCACSGATPLTCQGICCAGTGCCTSGTPCQTVHSNGLGQSFFDCNPLYTPATTTRTAALAAANAWAPDTGANTLDLSCNGTCLARQSVTNSCAMWCYGSFGTFSGHVTQGAMLCSTALCSNFFAGVTPTWQ